MADIETPTTAEEALMRYEILQAENAITPEGWTVPHSSEKMKEARDLWIHLANLERESREYNRIRK